MSNVPFINCFQVPAGREEVFFALWKKVNAYMQNQPGYVSHELHRSLAPDAHFRFVNYVLWESVDAWKAAHDEGFFALVNVPEWKEFTTTSALYEIVHTGGTAAVAA